MKLCSLSFTFQCFSPSNVSPHPRLQTISFIEISIEAGILLGGKHEACFVLGVAEIEPMLPGRDTAFALSQLEGVFTLWQSSSQSLRIQSSFQVVTFN
jgi:hypothetical protein